MFSEKNSVCVRSLLFCYVSSPSELMTLWLWGLGYCPRLRFLKWKLECQGSMSGSGHSRKSCTSVGWFIMCNFSFFFFGKSWLSPYWSVCVWHSRHLVLHFQILVPIRNEVEVGMMTQHRVVVFLFYYLYYINNGHVHFIVQRNH